MTNRDHFILLLFPLLLACGGRSKAPAALTSEGNPQMQVDLSESLLAAGLSDTVDLGVIHAGEKIRHEIMFHNDGDRSLVILSVKTTCGCTQVDFPKSPLPADSGAPFAFTFDSQGFSGFQFKTISVYTSVSPQPYRLIVTGEVR